MSKIAKIGMKYLSIFLIIATFALLSGCGQTGPLFLPAEDPVKTTKSI